MKDEPAPKPGKPVEVPHPPTEAEFKTFVTRVLKVSKAEIDAKAALVKSKRVTKQN